MAAARDLGRPHGHANAPIFCAKIPRATCKARIKIDSATALRAAPAPPKHGGRLERRRRSIRVEMSATTSPAGWRANGRQHGGGIFITRGGGGWLAADLQGELMASEGRGLPGAKGRRVLMPPFSPQVAPQADERSGLRAQDRPESVRNMMCAYWACAGAVYRTKRPLTRPTS